VNELSVLQQTHHFNVCVPGEPGLGGFPLIISGVEASFFLSPSQQLQITEGLTDLSFYILFCAVTLITNFLIFQIAQNITVMSIYFKILEYSLLLSLANMNLRMTSTCDFYFNIILHIL